MANSRRALHAYVSGDAHESWQRFATTAGVTISAMLEVLASQLPSEHFPGRQQGVGLDGLIIEARQLDAERRRRR